MEKKTIAVIILAILVFGIYTICLLSINNEPEAKPGIKSQTTHYGGRSTQTSVQKDCIYYDGYKNGILYKNAVCSSIPIKTRRTVTDSDIK